MARYLSTQGQSAVNARDRIGPGPWFNVRGARIAQNVEELHSRANRAAAFTMLDERGNQIPGSGFSPNRHDILTGSQPDGRGVPAGADMTCSNWTSSSDEGGAKARVGHHDYAAWNSTTIPAAVANRALVGTAATACSIVSPCRRNSTSRETVAGGAAAGKQHCDAPRS